VLTIRPEHPDDAAAVRAVHRAAFPTSVEAGLLDRLRAAGDARVALVADVDTTIVGHVLFSAAVIEEADGAITTGLGLAPLAVLPAHQRQGIGSALVSAGLQACRRSPAAFVVVLGHRDYYRRFGFRGAAARHLRNQLGAGDNLMVLELAPETLPAEGLIKYASAFDRWKKAG
jgi:putative acetyltransferase